MRKMLSLLLVAILALSLVACGGGAATSSGAPSSNEPASSAPVSSESSEPTSSETVSSETGSSADPTTKPTGDTTVTTTKQPTATTTTTTKAPITTTTAAPVPTERLVVTCWGDSITQGAWMALEDKYPTRLQALLGDGYEVLNGGYAGDSSYGIMARQGATGLKTKNAIIFAAGEKSVVIGHRVNGMGLLMDDGRELTKLNVSQALSSVYPFINCNPITVGGKQYTLGITNLSGTDGDYDITLNRTDASAALTIPAGTKAVMNGSDISANNYCDIYLMGVNDGVGAQASAQQISDLIARYKKLVANSGDNYLIIIPFWGKVFDDAFIKEFGDHAVPFRTYAAANGMELTGLTPTKLDSNMMKSEMVPASLRYDNNASQVHLNAHGYKVLAQAVYEQGKKLGYWK